MTLSRIGSYAQLAIMVWLIWELAITEGRWRALLYAYCIGACVSSINAIRNLAAGMSPAPDSALEDGRYAPAGFDQNEFALLLALSIPMAVYLLTRRQSWRGAMLCWAPTASGDHRHSADRVARRPDFAGRRAHDSVVRAAVVAGWKKRICWAALPCIVAAAILLVPAATWDAC